jgi:outer membrane receptor protein involved in Fe transport
MKRIVIRSLMGLFVLGLWCTAVLAQATGQIGGTVRDQTGAVLPGVEVTATQTETGIARTAVTNETGSYVLSNLATGPYRLEAGLPGFRTFVQTGIILQVSNSLVINPTLEVGQVSEQIEVQANAVQVETRTTGVGQVIENQRILELPLNGRQVTDLITLSGAAVQTGTASPRAMQGGVALSVAGGQSNGIQYVLDGAMHNNPYDGLNLPLPFPDALQEFKVETGALMAQNGMHSGAAVNGVTKSGTNEFHGSLFEFVRNYKFNARKFFASTRDSLKRNQFGGTIGGPVIRNKLFFFAGYQKTITRQDPNDNVAFVPTAAALTGDFTTLASAACNAGTARTLRAPFVNNRVDPARYSRAALALAAKLPKTDDPCGRITYGTVLKPDEPQYVGRLDYQWTDKHSLFGRFMQSNYETPPPKAFTDNILTTTVGGRENLALAFTLGDTYLISPNVVNSARIAANRTNIHRTHAEDFFDVCSLGVQIYCGYLPKYTIMTVTGAFNLGSGSENEFRARTNSFQIADDVSIVHGNHQIAFGASTAWWDVFHQSHVRDPGVFAFNGSVTGLGLADLLTGSLFNFTGATPNEFKTTQKYLGAYAQDTWKVTPKLTVNAGLRWEPWFPQVLPDGRIYNFDYERFKAGVRTMQFGAAPAGLYYPGDPGFPGNSGVNKRWLQLSPRLGLAWDPAGDGRLSVRASYSLGYDFPNSETFLNSGNAPPWNSTTVLNVPAGGFDNPWLGVVGGNPFPVTFDRNAPYTVNGAYIGVDPNVKSPYIQSWNFAVQRQLGTSWIASASYIGNTSTHLWASQRINPGIYIPGGPCTLNGVTYPTCSTDGNLQDRRRFSLERPADGIYLGTVDMLVAGATSNYHGLLLSVQRRAASGITVSSNYTLSHCIGDNNVGYTVVNANSPYVDPNNRGHDRGNCDGDRRHIFNFTTVAETPQFARPTLRLFASGWRLSGLYRASTGSYLSILSGIDQAKSGQPNQRASQVLGSPYGTKSYTNYLNVAAFAQPALGTYGNSGRNSVRGPSSWGLDVALSRTFTVREAQRLEFRAEAFNLTNSTRFGNPGTNRNATNTFGVINSSQDARVMQFALKYVF